MSHIVTVQLMIILLIVKQPSHYMLFQKKERGTRIEADIVVVQVEEMD